MNILKGEEDVRGLPPQLVQEFVGCGSCKRRLQDPAGGLVALLTLQHWSLVFASTGQDAVN